MKKVGVIGMLLFSVIPRLKAQLWLLTQEERDSVYTFGDKRTIRP